MEKKTIYLVKYSNEDKYEYREYEFGAFESEWCALESIPSIKKLLASKQKEYEELERKIEVISNLKYDLMDTFLKYNLINEEKAEPEIEYIERYIEYYTICQRSLGKGVDCFQENYTRLWVEPVDIYTKTITNL